MQTPIPTNEEARLENLRSYGILDTAPEHAFDDLTALAAEICETPIALVSLIDANRQWFKSKVGLSAAETSRDIAFCAHAIAQAQPDPFVVGDASRDPRFAANPLVTGDPNIRFYAGVPLISREGFALGTFCVIDRQPRQLGAAQMNALVHISRQVTREIGMRRAVQEQAAVIAAMKAAEEERDRFFTVSLDLMCISRFDGYFIRLNPAWKSTLGYDSEDLMRLPFIDFVHPEDRERTIAETARLVDGGDTIRFENRYRCKDGTYRWFLWNAAPDAEHGLIYASARDITEIKIFELRLQQTNAELEFRNQRIEEASRMKSEFLANMSHELRTPLNSIIGFAELLHDDHMGPVAAEHKDLLGDILTSGRHLLQLINDILDLSKVEAGKQEFRPEPIDLNLIVKEVAEIVRAIAHKKKIRIQVGIDEEVRRLVLDPSKLKQVLYNYLSNAVKFTPEGGLVQVQASTEGETQIRIEVTDSGIGIAKENLLLLFKEFQQLDQGSSKKYQGTGLGLALTKKLVEAQGGRVGVRSTPGEGSTFFAILPRNAGVRAEAAPREKPSHQKPSILVIESNTAQRELLVRSIRDAGFAAEGVGSGRDAIDLCGGQKFDAISLELQLPDASGWEVLTGIRSSSLNHQTPVILVQMIAELGIAGSFAIHDILWKSGDTAQIVEMLRNAGILPGTDRQILVIDDDPGALKLMQTTLSSSGYFPTCRTDAAEVVLETGLLDRIDAIILDLMMPGMDGFEFLDRLRATPHQTAIPVIIWTSKDLSIEENAHLLRMAQGVLRRKHGDVNQILDELRIHLAGPAAS